MGRFRDAIEKVADPADKTAEVTLDPSLLSLLSDQLYRSPNKAVEELVVNSYDANAKTCYVGLTGREEDDFLCVLDDGDGMDEQGLRDLWHVGHSTKTGDRVNHGRKQIGRFGIGKLASSAIGDTLLYISKRDQKILASAFSFAPLRKDATGGEATAMQILQVPARKKIETEVLDVVREQTGCAKAFFGKPSWTLAVIEDLRVERLSEGRVRSVLATALPLGNDFKVVLNSDEVEGRKDAEIPIIQFPMAKVLSSRGDALKKRSGETWREDGGAVKSDTLKRGVSGDVRVFEKSLIGGKSDDIMRSHGFFVRVRGRLVNPDDPLFGITERSFQTFNRFRCDVEAEDLDGYVLSSREEVKDSEERRQVRELLRAAFGEARTQYEEWLAKKAKEEKEVVEHERNFVQGHLTSTPIADALHRIGPAGEGAEADGTSFFFKAPAEREGLTELIRTLYSEGLKKVAVRTEDAGPEERVASFDLPGRTISLNQGHPFVSEYIDGPGKSPKMLVDFGIAEALLEMYLREAEVPPSVIGELLNRRDELLKALVDAGTYSPRVIAEKLRQSAGDEKDLEVYLTRGMRVLGFTAKQISGAGEPDAVATWHDYQAGQTRRLVVEAKSSGEIPQLGAIDFAGLWEHTSRWSAEGCLLVAPRYPGETKTDSAVQYRANGLGVSCWTVDDFAALVEQAERLRINARHVTEIVTKKLHPAEVREAVQRLLLKLDRTEDDILGIILDHLQDWEHRGLSQNTERKISGVHWGGIMNSPKPPANWEEEDTERAVRALRIRSKGLLELDGDKIVILGAVEQIRARVFGGAMDAAPSRSDGAFRGRQSAGADGAGGG